MPAAIRTLQNRGVDKVVLSLGAEGALFASGGEVYWAKSAPFRVESPVGCGDTLVAATLYGGVQGWSWKETASFALAAASAAARKVGTDFPDLSEVERAAGGISVKMV